MPRIVGVLPLAGQGSRLGMPFHKALSPTFTRDGILPLYRHAYNQLRDAGVDEIRFVVTEGSELLGQLPWGRYIIKREQGELPSSLCLAARSLSPDDLCIVALPDGIISQPGLLGRLVATHQAIEATQPLDGTLAVFPGPAGELDEVITDTRGMVTEIRPHTDDTHGRTVKGWGAFVATAAVLKGLEDERRLGPQLAEYAFAARILGGHYYDLGTPDRYRRYIAVMEN